MTGARLAAVYWTGSILTSQLGLLLHACDGWGCGRDRASGGDGAGLGYLGGSTAIGGVELLFVLGGRLSYLTLLGKRCGAGLTVCSDLCGAWPHVDSAASAVVAGVVAGASAVGHVVVDHRTVVDVGDVPDVGDAAVVIEVIVVPIATEVADADVSVAVVDTTVEANVGTPVAAVKAIAVAVVAPVGRRPESTVVRGWAPDAGNPVIATGTPCPVAGRPDVVDLGSGWLVVLDQGGRSLVGVGFDGILAGVLSGLVLIVVALDDGGGSLLLILVGFALLLGRVGGVGSEDLGVGGRGRAGGGCQVGVGRVGIATRRSGAVVDGGGVRSVRRAVFAAYKAKGEECGCGQ